MIISNLNSITYDLSCFLSRVGRYFRNTFNTLLKREHHGKSIPDAVRQEYFDKDVGEAEVDDFVKWYNETEPVR